MLVLVLVKTTLCLRTVTPLTESFYIEIGICSKVASRLLHDLYVALRKKARR